MVWTATKTSMDFLVVIAVSQTKNRLKVYILCQMVPTI